MIHPFEHETPQFRGSRIFLAPGADLVGRIILYEDTGIWFNATLRGDIETITIGRGTNIQDACTLHTDSEHPVRIGEHVTIGHNCVIHGCRIDDAALVGMGSVILNGARIGKNCLVGAGSLVTGSMDAPPGSLLFGSPAKIIKTLDQEEIQANMQNALRYIARKNQYLKQGIGLVP